MLQGKVYDVQDFRSQAPSGSDFFNQLAESEGPSFIFQVSTISFHVVSGLGQRNGLRVSKVLSGF